ncbi:hypothetical protein HK16_09720 [Acetobacter senegalensis]|uniref:Uncharacterized protein n=2 Tax=Acetobacter TaxID=434 RepID=A0A252EMD6_9PROT|nr:MULTISPECIES: hypothetical protein [Acetobacter]ATJ90420.1 hypothetical protein CIW82_06700 [Acetobacter tropicalis]OUL67581.1 hypothetical protein HK16_09720 [Acetobacter senegalensis]
MGYPNKLASLTDEQRALMVREYLAGATCEALSRKYGCRPHTLREYIKRSVPPGQYRHGSALVITDAVLKKAKELSRDGVARKDVAERLGVNLKTLEDAFRRRGQTLSAKPFRTRHETLSIIVDCIKAGLSQEEMAKRAGITEASLTTNKYYRDAIKLVGSTQKPEPTKPKPVNIADLSQDERNAIAANAMWRGLERWRGVNR